MASSGAVRLAQLAVAAAFAHLLAFVALHVLEPDVSMVSGIISDYGHGEYAWLQRLSFVFFAVMWGTLSGAMSILPQRRPTIVARVIFVAVVPLLLVGAVVPSAMDPRDPTFLSTVLNASRPAQFLAMLLVSVGLRKSSGWEDLARVLLALTLAACVLLAVSLAFLLEAGYAGLTQRAVFAIFYGWVGLLSVRLMRAGSQVSSTA